MVKKMLHKFQFLEMPRNANHASSSLRLMWRQSTWYVKTESFNVLLYPCFVQYSLQCESTLCPADTTAAHWCYHVTQHDSRTRQGVSSCWVIL